MHSFEIVIQFILPDQLRAFVYHTNACTFTGSSNLILNEILNFKKSIYSNDANRVKLRAGLGISATFISEHNINFKDGIAHGSINVILFIPGALWYHKFGDAFALTLLMHRTLPFFNA